MSAEQATAERVIRGVATLLVGVIRAAACRCDDQGLASAGHVCGHDRRAHPAVASHGCGSGHRGDGHGPDRDP